MKREALIKKKPKVVIFEDKFGNGGIEKFIFNLCWNIDRTKYDFSLVVVNKITEVYDSLFEEMGIEIIELVNETLSDPVSRFKKGVPKFKLFLKESKVDIIHFNLSDSIDLLYVREAKKVGVPVRILHSHNSMANSRVKVMAHRMGMLFLKNTPNYFWACSHEAARWLFPSSVYAADRYELIHNAIELDNFTYSNSVREEIRAKYGWENQFIVGHVGRFNAQKNHKFLIDIFEKIVEQNKCSKLILVGSGQLKDETENYVKEKRLQEQVVFWGESDEVGKLLQGFDLFLLPSLYEGLPFVLVESQAAALPALVSDVITKDVDCTQYLDYFPLDRTAQEWAAKAIEIHSNDVKRESPTMQLVEAGFDCKEMAGRVDNLYREAYAEQNGK